MSTFDSSSSTEASACVWSHSQCGTVSHIKVNLRELIVHFRRRFRLHSFNQQKTLTELYIMCIDSKRLFEKKILIGKLIHIPQ
jgi:hypothetical protein